MLHQKIMPYIKDVNRRFELTAFFDAKDAGELNFVFTYLIQRYLKQNGVNYQHINDVLGALEGSKLEFYRRFVGDYEDIKISQNGDVYHLQN